MPPLVVVVVVVAWVLVRVIVVAVHSPLLTKTKTTTRWICIDDDDDDDPKRAWRTLPSSFLLVIRLPHYDYYWPAVVSLSFLLRGWRVSPCVTHTRRNLCTHAVRAAVVRTAKWTDDSKA